MLFQWSFLIIVTTIYANPENYKITIFDKNPGLFYERLKTIRFIQTYWRLTIFIDFEKLQNHFPMKTLIREIDQIFINCARPYTEPCEQTLRPHILREKVVRANNMFQDATNLLTNLKETPLDMENLPITMRKRRSPLDFIGQALKPIIGILTTEDGEIYNEAIDELYELNRNLSHLVGKQTHIIRSDLQKLYEEADRHSEVLNHVRNNLKGLNALTESLNRTRYYIYLAQWTQSLETQLDHFIHALKEIIQIILSAREGKFHPSLLNSEQLVDIKNRLQTINKNYDFPIQGSRILAEEISTLARTKTGYHKEKFLMLVDIPLLNKNIYKIYKIHSYPVPQNIKPQNYSAYIIPETPYIIISEDRRSYIYMDQESLNTCIKTDTYDICDNNQPIFEINALKTCESQLLLEPNEKALDLCDIRLKINTKTYWKQVTTLGGWLFSTPSQETMTITCPDNYERRIKISGFGLLRLGNTCVGRSSYITITGGSIQNTGIEYLYQPDLSLNISTIISNTTDLDNIPILDEFLTKDELFQTTKWDLSEGTPLSEIENQLKVLSTHQRKPYSSFYRDLFRGLSMIGIIISALTTYYVIRLARKP